MLAAEDRLGVESGFFSDVNEGDAKIGGSGSGRGWFLGEDWEGMGEGQDVRKTENEGGAAEGFQEFST